MVADTYQALPTCQAMDQAFYFHYLSKFSHDPKRLKVPCMAYSTLQTGQMRLRQVDLPRTTQLAVNGAGAGIRQTNSRTCALTVPTSGSVESAITST